MAVKRRLAMTHLPEEVTPTDDEDLKRRLLDNLDTLDRAGKLKVLDFSRELVAEREAPRRPRDTQKALLALSGSIPEEDLKQMRKAIEEGCEQVDEESW
jgi:hypothetical protein